MPTAAYAYAHPWSRGQIMAFLQVMITLSCVLRMVCYQRAGLLAGIPFDSCRRAGAAALRSDLARASGAPTHSADSHAQVHLHVHRLSGLYYLLLH